MKLFTIGYGGRTKDEFLTFLRDNGVRTVVDVRLRPDRASMGIWVKAKTPDKGIEKMLSDAGIGYRSLVELGNLFLDFDDWQQRYGQLLESTGELLVGRLAGLAEPICLLCGEKRVGDRHRQLIAEYLARTQGAQVQHLESTANGHRRAVPRLPNSVSPRHGGDGRQHYSREGSRPFRVAARRVRGGR